MFHVSGFSRAFRFLRGFRVLGLQFLRSMRDLNIEDFLTKLLADTVGALIITYTILVVPYDTVDDVNPALP